SPASARNHHTNGSQADNALTINLDQSDEAAQSQDTKLLSKHILALGAQDDAILPPDCPNR
ncbi:hypothetical protein, partial [Ruegeria sp. HKCCA5463]|uniref:hypothetical protein n=1 Tax=Ruegeria sp. HKCCA5463 TaxID=2682994 RepID=UPI001C2CAE70